MKFTSQHPHFEYLKNKWTRKHEEKKQSFLEKHGDYLKHLTLGGLGSMMLLTTPTVATLPNNLALADGQSITKGEDKNAVFADNLQKLLPDKVRKLTTEEENKITMFLSQELRVPIKEEMEGIKLNRSYGLIGGEQHLYRYPGDNLHKHTENAADWAMFGPAGIAPGLGAWGYFAPSEANFTKIDRDRERYYIAVQTFLAPGFTENVNRYYKFFKYRKMLVINPITGQSVVTVIGDAGPAEWTGKHLGGSPEVMHELGLAKGPRKGAVLYFFINDPEDKIPLGPIHF